MKQNITLSLDKEVIRKAKVLAAHRDTSITGLVTEVIQRMVSEEPGYQAAKAAALKAMETGHAFGGKRTSRNNLHDR